MPHTVWHLENLRFRGNWAWGSINVDLRKGAFPIPLRRQPFIGRFFISARIAERRRHT
jgi:hypothetical protein